MIMASFGLSAFRTLPSVGRIASGHSSPSARLLSTSKVVLASVGPSEEERSASERSSLTVKPLSRDELFRKYPPAPGSIIREAWLETLKMDSKERSGELVPLHPAVWSVRPRIDIIKENVDWQVQYKTVSYVHARGRYELPGGTKRPWPQKGTGRARHASIRSPLWVQGGKAHGPKNPRSYFYMLSYHLRVLGLIHTLSVKFAQDDVHIVSDLEIPTNESKYVEDLIDERGWGLSTLIVGLNDFFPANLTAATDPILHVNLLPVYGLNVHSMLKHKTLVLTVDALSHLEERLLFALRRNDIIDKTERSMVAKSAPFH